MTALCIMMFVSAIVLNAQTPSTRVGDYEISLRTPADGLSAAGEMQLEFRIVNAAKVDPVLGPLPVIRAKIETIIDMPQMPGMPKLVETAHPESVPGDYGIHPTFAHGGEYRLRMNVAPPAGQAFDVEFPLKVLDAGSNRTVKPRFRLDAGQEPRKPKAGEPFKLRLTVRERNNGRKFTDFEVMHEKLMHLVIIRSNLTGFRHEHPAPMQDGSFLLEAILPEPGDYHLFADVAPRGAGSQILFATLKVGGKSRAQTQETRLGSAVVRLDPTGHIETGKTKTILARFHDANDDEPVRDLGTYLGAKAHLILIHQDAMTFVHSHPDERQPDLGADGSVPFLVRLPKPGIYRGWLQYVRAGVLHTAELQVEGSS